MSDSVAFLPVDSLEPNPFQPRDKIRREDLAELVDSIKIHGILEPLVIAQTPAGYQIIAGERRWRAAIEAGLKEVPVIIKKTTPRGMLEMALVENVQRTDLNALERAQAFQQLIREFGFAPSKVAQQVGKSLSYVSNSLRLLALPDAVKDGLLGGLITEGHARALNGLEEERQIVECYKIILKENASVRRAEELTRRYREESNHVPSHGRPIHIDDEKMRIWQEKFRHLFHTKSDFKVVRSHRQTKVSFMFKGSPEQTQADLERILQFAELGE
jgi:ParB family chromosome partitioning protein